MFHLLFHFCISNKVQCFIFNCSIDVTYINLIVFIVSFWHIDAHFRYMLLPFYFYCFICCFLISNFYLLFYLLSFCFIDDSGLGQRDFSCGIYSSICSIRKNNLRPRVTEAPSRQPRVAQRLQGAPGSLKDPQASQDLGGVPRLPGL